MKETNIFVWKFKVKGHLKYSTCTKRKQEQKEKLLEELQKLVVVMYLLMDLQMLEI